MPSRPTSLRLLCLLLLIAIPFVSCTDPTSNVRAPARTVTPPSVSHSVTLSGPNILVGAGDIATCTSTGDDLTAKLLDTIPGTVFTTGDNVYNAATLAEFTNCYNPSWGRQKARTQAVPGDKEYGDPNAPNASGYFSYFGSGFGDYTTGYYSYNLGTWHVIMLNSSVSMSAKSPQDAWLESDLAANQAKCTLAIWDQPRFYTNGVRNGSLPIWNDLYGAGAELVVNGHQRNYERFAPQTPDGTLDTLTGIREIIAATGGVSHGSFGTPVLDNSLVRDKTSFGVLKLTLNDSSYSWKFIPAQGSTFSDSGSAKCHGTPAPTANPGGPYNAENTVLFDGTQSSDPAGTALTYAWNFGDGSTGSGAAPAHIYTANGTYTVTLTVTNLSGSVSAPAQTTVTIHNIAPTVKPGPDMKIAPGATYTMWNGKFSDPGNDGPFNFTIDWGDGTTTTGSAADTSIVITGSHAYPSQGTYAVTLSVADVAGLSGSGSLTLYVAPFSTQAATLVGAGDVAQCGARLTRAEQTAKILDTIPGTIFATGDLAYDNGTDYEFANCYGPTWGRHRARTRPIAGNHEYDIDPGPYFHYFGAAAGDSLNGYYSFDLGGWHILVLNDNIPYTAGSPQEQWERADIAAHPSVCTMAFWHRPKMYSVGDGVRPSMKDMWQPLYDAGAEVIINAHQHYYERFEPVDPNGNTDLVRGIREFIVGTGGAEQGPPQYWGAHTEIQSTNQYGVIKFTLEPDGLTWGFISTAQRPLHDDGYVKCH